MTQTRGDTEKEGKLYGELKALLKQPNRGMLIKYIKTSVEQDICYIISNMSCFFQLLPTGNFIQKKGRKSKLQLNAIKKRYNELE